MKSWNSCRARVGCKVRDDDVKDSFMVGAARDSFLSATNRP
jgi:hypothetical protein